MKQTTKNRLLCVLLAALLLLFAACAEQTVNESGADSFDDVTESTVSKPGFEWIAELEDANGKYKGQNLNVISVSKELFYSEEENPLSRAVDNRNALLAQYLDISVSCTEKEAADIARELKQAVDSGTAYADLICAPLSVMSELAAQGLLENLYSLPYIDFGAGYMEKSVLDSQTAENTLYMYSGELTHSTNASVGLFYNKALVSSAYGDPVKLTKDGAFTWSALTSMVHAVAENGARGIDSLLGDTELAVAVYGSSGDSIVSAGGGKEAQLQYNAETAENTASIINGLFKNAAYSPNYDENLAVNAFKTGKLGFILAPMGSVSLFDGSSSEWGLLPLPKHSAEQSEYSSFIGANALAIGVPRGCKDSAFSGFALNALFAASANTLEAALKTTYINYHFWSNDAAVMLNRITRTARFDLGVIYSSQSAVSNVGTALLTKDKGGAVTDAAKAEFDAFASRLFY